MVSTTNDSAAQPATLATDGVLLAEFAELWPDEPAPATIDEYRRFVLDHGQAALCLSGGGIRSAAFALGVLQALAAKGLLTRFHYLSTVSGGGYIGSWLSRWINDAGGDADVVAASLRDSIVGSSGDPPQLKYLRENSNFITPRVGAASTDTWTAIALSVRNVVVNWLVFGPALLLIVLLFNLYESLFAIIRSPHDAAIMLAIGAVLLAIAGYHACIDLPSHAGHPRDGGYIFRWIALPSIAWALIVPLVMSPDLVRNDRMLPPGGYVAGSAFIAMMLGYAVAWLRAPKPGQASFPVNILTWLLACGVSAGALMLGATLLQHVSVGDAGVSCRTTPILLLGTIGPLWIVLSQLLVSIVFAAFRIVRPEWIGDAPGALKPGLDREWLARLSALKLRPVLLWTILACTSLLIPALLADIGWLNRAEQWVSAAITAVSGAIAVVGGKSGGTTSGHDGATAPRKLLSLHLVVMMATAIFAIFLFAFFALVERKLAHDATWRLYEIASGPIPDRCTSLLPGHIAWAIALLPVLWLTSTRVNVNRFSLNGLYRNRLARAFLGGARSTRSPDPFTGFDDGDDLPLHMLRATAGGRRRLFPVINVALNVVGGTRLAWQERKAEPFIFTPLASGSAMLDTAPAASATAVPAGAYVATQSYGGNERGPTGSGQTGITLATAISISGAAASPSMGYHSSPATAFLMTLFNVRLGAWLPNPARAQKIGRALGQSGPTNALRPLLSELAGLTNDKGDNVYLSDGGHFENLGLYEMIRRRCRFVVVADAGCDPNCRFEDLGNAIRKIAIDQDRVDISFQSLDIRSRLSTATPRYAFAIGRIRYPERPADPAYLLYIKPSYFEPMPMDVRSYAEVHDSFPHETTADQWFSESQFESYRRLGEYLTMQLGGAGFSGDLQQFFDAIAAQGGPSSAAAGGGGAPVSST